MPHQTSALRYATPRERIALYLEMRLGKSLVAIRWALHHKARRVLVVAPLSTIPGWLEELELEGLVGQQWNDKVELNAGWYVVNYERLRVRPALASYAWDAVILDESTRIRNPKAKVTKLVLKAFRHVPLRAVLSGLPAPEGLLDYVCQMLFLQERWLGTDSYWKFRRRFFRPDWTGHEWVPRPRTRDRIKAELAKDCLFQTRKQCQIGQKKIYETRVVPMTASQRKEYKLVLRDFETSWGSERRLTNYVLTQMIWLSRIAGGFHPLGPALSSAKGAEVLSLLDGDLRREQVVIWFRFLQELLSVSSLLQKSGYSTAKLYGATPGPERGRLAKKFRQGAYQVICVQLQCGRYGMNLSSARTAIYYSNSYSAEDRGQSEDRIIHPTKTDPVLLLDLVTQQTIDSEVVSAVRSKLSGSRGLATRIAKGVADGNSVR